jgi:hypothetical protein
MYLDIFSYYMVILRVFNYKTSCIIFAFLSLAFDKMTSKSVIFS